MERCFGLAAPFRQQAGLQILEHLLGGLITLIRILAHGTQDHILYTLRNQRIQQPRFFEFLLQMLKRYADWAFTQKRQHTG
ncbi:hypothetical protein D3C80_1925200 [compost metagenome]